MTRRHRRYTTDKLIAMRIKRTVSHEQQPPKAQSRIEIRSEVAAFLAAGHAIKNIPSRGKRP